MRPDLVFFDSPPLGAVTDPAIIAPQVDGVVLVLRSMKSTRDALMSGLRQVGDVGAKIIGGVLNDVALESKRYGYGASSYYYYYYRSDTYYGSDDGDPDGDGGDGQLGSDRASAPAE